MRFSNILPLLLAAVLLIPFSAQALDLDQAKANGWLGETPSGYVALVGAAPADAKQLADFINRKRREEYQKIASKQNQPVDAIGSLMAEKLYSRATSGHFLQQPDGSWRKK